MYQFSKSADSHYLNSVTSGISTDSKTQSGFVFHHANAFEQGDEILLTQFADHFQRWNQKAISGGRF